MWLAESRNVPNKVDSECLWIFYLFESWIYPVTGIQNTELACIEHDGLSFSQILHLFFICNQNAGANVNILWFNFFSPPDSLSLLMSYMQKYSDIPGESEPPVQCSEKKKSRQLWFLVQLNCNKR